MSASSWSIFSLPFRRKQPPCRDLSKLDSNALAELIERELVDLGFYAQMLAGLGLSGSAEFLRQELEQLQQQAAEDQPKQKDIVRAIERLRDELAQRELAHSRLTRARAIAEGAESKLTGSDRISCNQLSSTIEDELMSEDLNTARAEKYYKNAKMYLAISKGMSFARLRSGSPLSDIPQKDKEILKYSDGIGSVYIDKGVGTLTFRTPS